MAGATAPGRARAGATIRGGLTASAVMLTAAATALSWPSNADASAWARGKGRLFIASKAEFFAAKGETVAPNATEPEYFERITSDVYLEYGLSRTVTIGGKVIYGNATFLDGFSSGAGGGFLDAEVYAQYEILRSSRHAFSIKATGGQTSGDAAIAAFGIPGAGTDAELRILYGRDLLRGKIPVYAAAETAYRRRFGDGADQIRIDALIGVQPLKRALILVEAFSTTSLGNEDPGGSDFDLMRLQASAVLRLSRRIALQAGATHDAFGRNILMGDGYFLSMWTEF